MGQCSALIGLVHGYDRKITASACSTVFPAVKPHLFPNLDTKYDFIGLGTPYRLFLNPVSPDEHFGGAKCEKHSSQCAGLNHCLGVVHCGVSAFIAHPSE